MFLKTGGVVAAMVLAAGLVAGTSLAWADHGKAGLWDVSVHVDSPKMPKISAADRAQMKKMGVSMQSDNTMTTQHCMTQKEVESHTLSGMTQQGCTMKNAKSDGTSYSADMVCSRDEMKGTGHITAKYDSPEHYTGKMSFTGTTNGKPAHVENHFEGKWVSASCGNVKH
ncbi:MAG TPA: DUF3617 domain-containing protein [Rhizomicrobium sp.]|jgi:hypothetical protein|nr:DUF3617 domain-containing protein [Rhizomicrobium sp.]